MADKEEAAKKKFYSNKPIDNLLVPHKSLKLICDTWHRKEFNDSVSQIMSRVGK